MLVDFILRNSQNTKKPKGAQSAQRKAFCALCFRCAPFEESHQRSAIHSLVENLQIEEKGRTQKGFILAF